MKKIFFVSVALFLTTALFAGDIDFSADFQTLWGVGAPWTDSDKSAGKFTLGNTNFTGSIDAYSGNSSALAKGTISYDALTNSIDFSLGELWADYTSSFWGIRIGRQNPQFYEVLEGLEPGERVITNGYEAFKDNEVLVIH